MNTIVRDNGNSLVLEHAVVMTTSHFEAQLQSSKTEVDGGCWEIRAKANQVNSTILRVWKDQRCNTETTALHGFHETCHSVTFIVLVNSHQR